MNVPTSVTAQWLFDIHWILNSWMHHILMKDTRLFEMVGDVDEEQREWLNNFIEVSKKSIRILNPKTGMYHSEGPINIHLMMYIVNLESRVDQLESDMRQVQALLPKKKELLQDETAH